MKTQQISILLFATVAVALALVGCDDADDAAPTSATEQMSQEMLDSKRNQQADTQRDSEEAKKLIRDMEQGSRPPGPAADANGDSSDQPATRSAEQRRNDFFGGGQ